MRLLGTILLTAVEALLATAGVLAILFGADEREVLAVTIGAVLLLGALLAFFVGRAKTPPERRANLLLQGVVALLAAALTLGILFELALRGSRVSNERIAGSSLKTLASAEADFRGNDRDNDKLQEFWVRDVAGLYALAPEGGGEAIKLIEISTAGADDAPSPESARTLKQVLDFGPKRGYLFRALQSYTDEEGKQTPYDQGQGRNSSRFGFVAWPKTPVEGGRQTFILNEDNTMWKKDTGGKPVLAWPKDPKAEGWVKLD